MDLEFKNKFLLCSRIKVDFNEKKSVEFVRNKIISLSIPHIILWYIGCYGLKLTGAHFYKDQLINPILQKNSNAKFWLTDLTAWNAFKGSPSSIVKANSCCDKIEQIPGNKIRCIRSADFFKNIQNISDPELINYFRKALRKPFIRSASSQFALKNVFVKELFSQSCPILSDWYDLDVSKAYSVFQYLESFLVIDKIVTYILYQKPGQKVNIVFAIPNNEINYYRDSENSFQKDLEFFLLKRCFDLEIPSIDIEVKFWGFNYGSKSSHRPYNAPGRVIKSKNLSHMDIVG